MRLPTDSSLGERISWLRKQRGWTQSEFAEKIGVHARHVTRIERDKMKPTATTLGRLAEACEISLDDLLAESGRGPDTIADSQLLRTFHQAQELDGDDKAMVVRLIQALLTKKRMEQALRLEAS